MAPVGPVDARRGAARARARACASLTVRPPRRRYGAVFVAPTEAARGLAFDVVFVPGLAERLFPQKIVEDPILLDVSRARGSPASRLVDPGRSRRGRASRAPPRGRRRARARGPLLSAHRHRAGAAAGAVVLRARGAARGRGRLPGFDELALRARERGEARLGWPAPERPRTRSTTPSTTSRCSAAARRRRPEDDDRHGALPARRERAPRARAPRARPSLVEALDAGRRPRRSPTSSGAARSPRHQLAARSFSPTALQHFAACPYRFFLQAVHRLKPREEPIAIETIDPLTRGSLVHEVQFAVLSALRAEGLLPVRLENADRAPATSSTASST